jgi:hypothetical protein
MITLELTLEETNMVLSALAELPFRVSNQLIQKVQEQANKQLKQE